MPTESYELTSFPKPKVIRPNDGIEIGSILSLNDVGKSQGHFFLVISEAKVLPLVITLSPGV